jgi:Flp pilus assembly protein TadD
MKPWILLALLAVVLLAAFTSFARVGEKELAVLDPRFGEPRVLPAGFHFRAPLFLSSVSRYPLDPATVEGVVKVDTRDNLNFRIRYRMDLGYDSDTLLSFHARRAGRSLDEVRRRIADETVQRGCGFLRADEILGSATKERWLGALYPPAKERGIRVLEISADPVEPRVMTNAALVYQERNLPAAALQLARRAVEKYPEESRVHYGLGRVYDLQGMDQQAEEEYVQALFYEPAAREPMGRLVGKLLRKREFERARRLLDAALSQDRTSAPHFNWLGVTLQLEAKYEEAESAFRKATELDPKSAEYRANLGALQLQRGNPAAARETLAEAIRLRPDHTLALYNLGLAHILENRAAEALPFLERAETTGPATVGLLNALAKAYDEAGQPDRAIAALKRSLAMKPSQPDQQKLLKRLQGARGASRRAG